MLDLLQLTSLVPEQQGLMKIMQESAEGLMEVINNILDFCKIEAGRLILEEIDFSLSDTLEQVQRPYVYHHYCICLNAWSSSWIEEDYESRTYF